jgi:hypothetical protein
MTSGEGNPDTDEKLGRANGMKLVAVQPAVWKDPQCDRSADSWAARLGRSLENASTSVTFLDFACWGASIDDIVNGGYRGENPQRGDHPVPAEPVAARRVIGDPGSAKTRTVDAVLRTAGINDLGFGDALIFCTKNFVHAKPHG